MKYYVGERDHENCETSKEPIDCIILFTRFISTNNYTVNLSILFIESNYFYNYASYFLKFFLIYHSILSSHGNRHTKVFFVL